MGTEPPQAPPAAHAAPMAIFTKTYDLVTWLIPVTRGFPRVERFVTTRRLQDATYNFLERILEANRLSGQGRLERLRLADADLDKVRLYLRVAALWGWLSEGQYHHVSVMVQEIGKMLGGWIKTTMGVGAARPPAGRPSHGGES